jgi:hypothetical protein
MKILLTEWYREWRGTAPQLLKPAALSLDDDKILFALVVSVGNGDYDEACIETDSLEAKEWVKGMLCGTGNAKPAERSAAVEQCRLFRTGYEVYLQGRSSYFFVNPIHRPELFRSDDLNDYVAEFRQM